MIAIRQAELRDSTAVFGLAKVFATSFAVEQPAFELCFKALLQSPGALVAVAADGDRVVGYLLGFAHHAFYANGPVAWVEEIMVAEEFRRRGVGRELMRYFEQWAIARKATLAGLATRRAAPFYRALGYEESAVYFRKLL